MTLTIYCNGLELVKCSVSGVRGYLHNYTELCIIMQSGSCFL